MQALAGVRVLDLTRLLPGPYGSLFLADFGAEVIKVEEPRQGDYEREFPPPVPTTGIGYRYYMLNRNKKSVAINLKDARGPRRLSPPGAHGGRRDGGLPAGRRQAPRH